MHDKPPPFVAGGEPQTLLFRPTQPDNSRQAALPPELLSDDAREAVLNMEGSRLEQRTAAGGDDSQQAANTSPEAPAQMECWACATLVQIPVVDGKLAPDFKCGYCGAITQKKKKRHCHGARRKRPGLGGKCCDRLCLPFEWMTGTWVCQLAGAGVQWVVVLIVLGIITSLISMGVGCILPRLQWQALHLLLAALFSFNIYFNYYQVVRQSPGSPQEIPGFQSLKTVPRTPYNPVCNGDGDAHNNDSPHKLKDSSLMGAFDNYTLCTYCDDFKPPQAHHCRICKRCVLEMDHHCPFVNNCIGASNVRPFMLFLFWASTATFYTMCAGIWALYYNSHMFLPRLARYRLLSMNPFTSSVMALVDMIADGLFGKDKLWIIGVVYSIFVSAGVTIGVGVLFALQMQQLFAGVSYIDALKYGKDSGKGASRMVHLQKVFGTGHPLTWILPRTTLPKGAATLQHLVKKGE